MHLRQAKHFSVVEILVVEAGGEGQDLVWKAWRASFIDVIKHSPSKNRKFLRWIVTRWQCIDNQYVREVVEAGGLEVLPESST